MPSRSFSLNCRGGEEQLFFVPQVLVWGNPSWPQPFVHQLRLENTHVPVPAERERLVVHPTTPSPWFLYTPTQPQHYIYKMYVWQTWQNQFWSIIIHNTTVLNLIRVGLITSTSPTSLGLHSNFTSISQ